MTPKDLHNARLQARAVVDDVSGSPAHRSAALLFLGAAVQLAQARKLPDTPMVLRRRADAETRVAEAWAAMSTSVDVDNREA